MQNAIVDLVLHLKKGTVDQHSVERIIPSVLEIKSQGTVLTRNGAPCFLSLLWMPAVVARLKRTQESNVLKNVVLLMLLLIGYVFMYSNSLTTT